MFSGEKCLKQYLHNEYLFLGIHYMRRTLNNTKLTLSTAANNSIKPTIY